MSDKIEQAKQLVTTFNAIILFMDLTETVVNDPPPIFTQHDIDCLERVNMLLSSLSMFDAK